ncbi:MAG: hypothetical protein ABEH86_02975 [Haloarcula sp.]
MVTFDCRAERVDGVTLVTATVGTVAEPTRITVRNRLEGPVWPPRREGVPEAGWDEAGFDGVVGPGTHALGYATPAQPADPPAELTAATPVPDETPTGERLDSETAVLRELGDPSPPADAVPAVITEDDSTVVRDAAKATGRARQPDQPLPDTVSQWLDTIAHRVDRAERLAAADSLAEATAAVRMADGLSGVKTVAARADTDEQMLRALARRAERLADRRAAATVPTETLSRLA